MIDPVQQSQLRARYNPDGSDQRRAQLRMLEMLKFVDSFCKENDIKYWLEGGTLLGAMRHGGFIPWDDDTDICMTYSDAEKFKRLMIERKPHPDFVIQCHETDPTYYGFWYVLRDLKSEYFQPGNLLHERRKYRGLQIDIFPMRTGLNRMLHRLSAIMAVRLVERPLRHRKSPHGSFQYRMLRHVVFPMFRALSRIGASPLYRLDLGVQWYQAIPPEAIFPLGRAEFEGIQLSVPHDPDAYLTRQFGRWKHVPDHDHIVDHKTSYAFYD